MKAVLSRTILSAAPLTYSYGDFNVKLTALGSTSGVVSQESTSIIVLETARMTPLPWTRAVDKCNDSNNNAVPAAHRV